MNDIIKSAEELMCDTLMFGVGRPTIDLNELRDAMTESRHGFSIMEDPLNRLEGGYLSQVRAPHVYI